MKEKQHWESDTAYFIRKRATHQPKKITLVVDEAYVSCDMCACCYGSEGALNPTWCQVYSHEVDPYNFEYNREIANKCESYVPKFMARSMVFKPEIIRWYEKD